MRYAILIACLLLFSCSGGNTYNISFELVTPLDEANDPFATMKTINIKVINPYEEDKSKTFIYEPTDSFDDFAAALSSMEYWPEVVMQVKGFDPEETLVAKGQSTILLTKYNTTNSVAIYLAPPLSISIPPQSVQMRHKRAGVKLVVPSSSNLLMFGGIEMDKDKTLGNTVAEVGLFSPQSYYLDVLEDGENNYLSGNGKGMAGHTVTALNSGSILLTGGYSRIADEMEYLKTPIILSAATTELENEVIPKDNFAPRTNHCATLNFAENYTLVCGGEDQNGNKLKNCFKVVEDTLSMNKLFDLKTNRSQFTQNIVVDINNEYLGTLIYGGTEDNEKPAEWLPYQTTESILPKSTIKETRTLHAAATLSQGRVIIIGGLVDDSASTSAILFDANCIDNSCDSFTLHSDTLKTARYGHTLTAISETKVLACGGYNENNLTIADCELLNITDDNKIENLAVIPMNYSRAKHDAAYLPDGTVMIAGGYNEESGALNSVEIFMPEEF